MFTFTQLAERQLGEQWAARNLPDQILPPAAEWACLRDAAVGNLHVRFARTSAVLSVHAVTKSFASVRAVGVSFTMRRGTITGLLGRNGVGKTTTIRMITGIFLPDNGTIEWVGGWRDRIGGWRI